MGAENYTTGVLLELLGVGSYKMYERINNFIMDSYNVNQVWDKGGKYGEYCLRYTRSGKTLCTLYFRRKQLGVWIVLGKDERVKFESTRNQFPPVLQEKYDQTTTYHDGKWLMFDLVDDGLFDEIVSLLMLKKSPNRKLTMCGYCCDMCKAFAVNIKKKDERDVLAEYWRKYYNLYIPREDITCDGCRCTKATAHRIDSTCPIRACVLEKKLTDCSECEQYPCDTFLTREGLSYTDACEIEELDIPSYYDFLSAFDNRSRLDRKLNK